MVYYLKYRPQALSELIGQESVKKTLSNSFQNNKLAHAYLFVGPRGTGKTSTARILAKMVNCESQEPRVKSQDNNTSSSLTLATSDFPCNKCPTCISITDGSNLDLIEIDAASNRGIEDIRSLRDKIKLAPSSAKKKVYIIDEVHMLTTEAFNALLKTLEEPPAHTLFILATTEGAKVPQTILSRVQKLDFKLASSEELLTALKKIITEEKIDIDDEALKALIKKSDGSFRDGVKLLDQVASLGEKITAKLIEENFKSGQFEDVLDLIQSFNNKDAKAGLLNIGKQVEKGIDIKQLILSLMDSLRSLALIKNGVGEQLVKSHLTEDKYQSLVKLSGQFANQDLTKTLDLLQAALEKLKFASIPSLPLELVVVEICNGQSDDQSELPSPVVFSAIEPQEVVVPTSVIPSVASNEDNEDIIRLKEKWTFVLETIRPVNFSLEALLRSINILDCSGTSVAIEVPYAFHQRILEAPKNRDLLEGILSDILGRSIRVSTVLGSRSARREDIANIEIAQDDEIIRAAAEIFNSDTVN
ncbi:DNA polymerase III subunit gamma/tau [Candidatus Daviesbacteria bacterium]|nr:DNA polymerase III subunit gamma/tau [Candidatus Daviesbacteria bacterium]